MLKMFNVAKAKVLVFIPPPVEAGEAPIHIKKITNNKVGTDSCVKSIVLNPAVLGVTALNAVDVIFPNHEECKFNVLLYSEIQRNTNPPTNKIPVVYKTILEFKVIILTCL